MSILVKFWHKTLNRPHRLHIHYDKGTGKAVILLHGLASSSAIWQPLFNQLPNRSDLRIVAVDLLGFGKSPKPDYSQYDIAAHAESVAYTLRRLNINSAVVVGHSMGCLVATHLAVISPKLVDKLILYEPPLFADDPAYRSHARRRDMYTALFQALLNRPQLVFAYSRVLRNSLNRLAGATLTQQTWLPFDRSLRNTIMKQSAYRELRAITIPTDIIHGRFDIMVTRLETQQMFKHNDCIKLHLINQKHDVTPSAARYILKLI